MTKRDKAILTGLYLSKFDKDALAELGFTSFQEAFNVLGISLGTNPSSIKNYRDEFDPLFSNNRRGWHKRPIREYCKAFYTKYNTLDFAVYTSLVQSFFIENSDVENFIAREIGKEYAETVAKRLMTGKAAEEYFKLEYLKVDYFKSCILQDTTNMACGFDYKLTHESLYYCVEVKGVNTLKGNIQLTEKEFHVAQKVKEKYVLFIVKNFKEKPVHEIIFDPLNSRLKFTETRREVIQLSYNSSI